MGYVGKLDEKNKAIDLRKKGLSYSEIRDIVKVSKDTLSRWCRDIVLDAEHMERLRGRKLDGSARGRIKGAKTIQARRVKEIVEMYELGKEEVGQMSKRDRFIAGVSMYLSEGYKTDKSFGFTNSDPKMIKFMIDWIQEFCDLSPEKMSGQIWIHDNLDEIKAKDYWSNLTGIPTNRFQKSYIAKNKTDSIKVRKNIHEYGVFAIRIGKARLQRRILGWQAGILEAKKVK